MKKYLLRILFFSGIAFIITSCNNSGSEADDESDITETITPVTITHPTITDIKETLELNAVSS